MTLLPVGSLVLVPFPFTDCSAQKRRPALVLSQPQFQRSSGHLLVAMVTTTRQSTWLLDWSNQQWQEAGLPRPCLVRFKLFMLDQRLILSSLGALSSSDRDGVIGQLQKLLGT